MTTVIYKQKNGVAQLTLNRPEAGNAINEQLAGELSSLCQQIKQDKQVVVVVISGAGAHFCLESELKPLQEIPFPAPAAAVASIDCPVIAAINGDAIGLGLELALSCDLRIASEEAHFCLPQVADGFMPWNGGSQRLPRIVGRAKALELLLTGRTVDAAEALRIGLVNKIVPAKTLQSEVQALAANLAAKGPIALRYAKEAIHKGLDVTLEQGLRLESDLYFLLHTTSDRTEGVRAFLEKRPPRFKGA